MPPTVVLGYLYCLFVVVVVVCLFLWGRGVVF